MFGRVVTFMAGGWLAMSAFAWPQSEAAIANTCLAGALAVAFSLAAIFLPEARYLNTGHACIVCLVSLSLDASPVALANNVMVSAVIFGASLLSGPERPVHGASAWTVEGSNASSTGLPFSPGGAG